MGNSERASRTGEALASIYRGEGVGDQRVESWMGGVLGCGLDL